LDETLNALRKEKLAIRSGKLTELVRSVEQNQPNVPTLDGTRRQRKKKKLVRYVRSERDEDEYAFTANSATYREHSLADDHDDEKRIFKAESRARTSVNTLNEKKKNPASAESYTVPCFWFCVLS